jgi:hypothetical protein
MLLAISLQFACLFTVSLLLFQSFNANSYALLPVVDIQELSKKEDAIPLEVSGSRFGQACRKKLIYASQLPFQ